MGRPQPRRGGAKTPAPELAPAVLRVQNLLTHRLSTRVVIQHGEKKGSIHIEYYGDEDLNRILSTLGVNEDGAEG
jgi:ParB family chromosome partitioning protein